LSPELVIIGVIPKDISAGLELTPVIKKALPLVAEAIRKELETSGFKVSARE